MGVFDLKIGFSCNNNCAHCVVANKRLTSDASLEELKEIVSKIPQELSVQITGGEPSIHSYLPELLKYCKELGHKTSLQTNATGFANNYFCCECAPYLDHAHVAIHSSIPEIHDRIVGTPGMWEKTMKGFDNLLASGVFLTTQTVLSQYNIDSLYETYQFIQNKKPGIQMSMTYPHLMGNAWNNKEEVAFKYSDHKEMFQDCLRDFHMYLFTESIPYCYLHPYIEVPSLEKDILTNFTRIGFDLAEPDNIKVYNDLNLQEHLKGPRCKDCIYNPYCIGVWKEYIELYKDCLDLYPVYFEEES